MSRNLGSKKLALCLAVILLLGVVPRVGLSAEYSVEVGDGSDLADAFINTTSGSIVLKNDITLETLVQFDTKDNNQVQTLTLDLKNYTLTIMNEWSINIINSNDAKKTLTITGDGKGVIDMSQATCGLMIGKNGTLILESGVTLIGGAIQLEPGAVLEGFSGLFKDRGIPLDYSGPVTVGSYDAEASAEGLSEGIYYWDDKYFATKDPVTLNVNMTGNVTCVFDDISTNVSYIDRIYFKQKGEPLTPLDKEDSPDGKTTKLSGYPSGEIDIIGQMKNVAGDGVEVTLFESFIKKLMRGKTYILQFTAENSVRELHLIIPPVSLTVEKGTISGHGGSTTVDFAEGDVITIIADPAPEGEEFNKWESEGITLPDLTKTEIKFTMPGNDVKIKATYKEKDIVDNTKFSLKIINGTITDSGSPTTGNYAENEVITITANPAPDGKIFDKWTTDNGGTFGDSTAETTTFIMPGAAVTIEAIYRDKAAEIIPETPGGYYVSAAASQRYIICNLINVPYSRTSYFLSSNVEAQTLREIVDNALAAEDGGKTVKFNYAGVSGSSTRLTLMFDASRLKPGEDVTFIAETSFGMFIFTAAQMQKWFDGGFGKYTITLEKSSLRADVKKDGVSAVWHSLTPMARIGVFYTPETGENTGYLAVTAQNGRVLPTSTYENNMVFADIFAAGTYKAAALTPSAFTDTAGHWAEADINFAAAFGLISGTGAGAYSPGAAITRADYLTALVRLSGADVSGYRRGSFNDVYLYSAAMPYIEWAYQNNIVEGVGGGRFEPDSPITREQMAQMMVNFANALGFTLPAVNAAADYADNALISGWARNAVTAMRKTGIMNGDENRFNPLGSATRAEAAAILRRFMENVISSRSAEGWSNDNKDLGKRVYYTRNGVNLTGRQNIDGGGYFFGEDGVMQTGWLDMDGRRYYFFNGGVMAAGKWERIGNKWYYFYGDGTLAVNTVIDGYTVGADGARK